ncbi:hypothetical protein SPRG_12887 [Saprolegnia parasitica CBS 223.65]|uniref:Uncharacterized protein n=1 Tax=Saprolegnia parasitica (strain CBS 223.65) TaxID=695850 RepID=A0A067C528_SAPPC|nr:hypothetical protein SPRG_12887 [Saprolegnia parasitica CBS 223.65]KDO21646.1 hypothetical protein SPRG_12887 [Saprolegnia parasitica CBS 223.65]|eukprot:XP_012207658.1 hypothetical protein SPRG_12887 [Saprolegnia parasitica CBS 223.65]
MIEVAAVADAAYVDNDRDASWGAFGLLPRISIDDCEGGPRGQSRQKRFRALGLWCIEVHVETTGVAALDKCLHQQDRVGLLDHDERQTLEATCQELRRYSL